RLIFGNVVDIVYAAFLGVDEGLAPVAESAKVPRPDKLLTVRRHCSFRKNMILRNFRPPFVLLSSRVGIRDADRRERSFVSLGDHTEFGDLKLLAPERLLRVPEYLGPGWSVDGLGCNE